MDEENKKTRPNDSSEANEEQIVEVEENNSAEKTDEEYNKDMDELEIERKELEEKKKKELERLRKDHHAVKNEESEEDDANTETTNRIVSRPQKEFSMRKNLFRHRKLFGLSGSGAVKVDNVLKRAHLNAEKRQKLIQAISAYSPSKSVLKKRDFDMFAKKFKSKNFSGNKFKEGSKTVDFKELREDFTKKDLNRFRTAMTGEQDPHRFQTNINKNIKRSDNFNKGIGNVKR